MKHELPELPFAPSALEPHISAETLEYHHGKHHAKYVANLNELIPGTAFEELPLEMTVCKSTGKVFNNAAQNWNHTFYWNCLSPEGGGEPAGPLAEAINKQFGSLDQFRQKFNEAAISLFGSGWTWLVHANGALSIQQGSNAETPLSDGSTPILTCDVWEHAYYIDYRNARAKYLDAFWKLINWEFAGQQYQS
jgi:Fe-Mn family superoxide dismutase